MINIQERVLAKLNYRPPEDVITEIGPMVEAIQLKLDLASRISDHDRNRYLEIYQGASLAYLHKLMSGEAATITICAEPADDYDCIIRADSNSDPTRPPAFLQVQLKELPPHERNRKSDLQTTITKLILKYPKSHQLAVGIWINRDINLMFETLDFSNLEIGQLWIFGERPDGVLTLDGGLVADLQAGKKMWGEMKDRKIRRCGIMEFKTKSKSESAKSTPIDLS